MLTSVGLSGIFGFCVFGAFWDYSNDCHRRSLSQVYLSVSDPGVSSRATFAILIGSPRFLVCNSR